MEGISKILDANSLIYRPILPFEVEQKVEIKGGAKISTELELFSLICNILRIKKTWLVSYFCPN